MSIRDQAEAGVAYGWTIRPFRAPGLCRCGAVDETFTVSDRRTLLADLCAVCVEHWTTTVTAVVR